MTNVDQRKVRAASNALITCIEHLSASGLREASGDTQLLDSANVLLRRIRADAARLGFEGMPR